MSRRTAAWLASSMLVLAIIVGVLGFLLLFLNDRFPPPSGDILLAFVSFLVVGVLIASRRPENPIGWMFCIIGLASVWEFFAHEYAFYALVTQPGSLPAGVWVGWSRFWTAAFEWPLMFLALLLFPNGRLPSHRWRPFAWFAAATFILGGVLTVIEPGRLPEIPVPNPTGIEGAAGIIKSSQSILIPPTLGIVLVMAASVIVRFRRARGEERQQMKWLAYSAGVLGSIVVLAFLNGQVLHSPVRLLEIVVSVVGVVAIAAVPVAIGVAILRYRLYEIDIVINRTLVYGPLTATLVALYFGAVVLLQRFFVALTGQESTLAVVASTLLIAALSNPLRHRIQSFIDRRFYRRKYDARKTLETFSTQLRDETDLEALGDDLVGVVRETMQPTHVSLWLRPDAAPQRQRPR